MFRRRRLLYTEPGRGLAAVLTKRSRGMREFDVREG